MSLQGQWARVLCVNPAELSSQRQIPLGAGSRVAQMGASVPEAGASFRLKGTHAASGGQAAGGRVAHMEVVGPSLLCRTD